MSKPTIVAVAAGVVAGAIVVGVPALAYAGSDSAGATNGSDMSSMMEDPAFREDAKAFMSEMMSDPNLREQMRDIMGDMGGMSDMGGMGGMGGMEGSAEEEDPETP